MASNARRLSFLLAGMLLMIVPGKGALGQAARRGLPTHFKNAAHLGAGWVANVPTSYLGFSVLGMAPAVLGGAGLYADVKLTTGSPGNRPGFLPGVTPEEAEITFGDLLFEQRSDWVTVDLALVYAVTPEFAVYGGVGYSEEDHYRQYFDESQTRGEFGFYWVADASRTGRRTNLLGGAIMRLAPFVAVQLGGQTAPRGVNVGVILTLAR